jgi:hypothetical protein
MNENRVLTNSFDSVAYECVSITRHRGLHHIPFLSLWDHRAYDSFRLAFPPMVVSLKPGCRLALCQHYTRSYSIL